ncbi:MAG: DNA polymerase IV [Deltaproteobacteria bacterium]|nr:MAG: DNA polymerase IV [Deltaproteobacteria bacterium]
MNLADKTARPSRICCLDLDCFFVSVERLFDPTLEGKPVVVGAKPGTRGVVTAASYEVRRYGVRSGMPIAEAVRRAPHAIFVRPRHGVYSEYSALVRKIVDRYSPSVQAASIDEFYVDFAGCEKIYTRPSDRDADDAILRTVRVLTATIQKELGLPSSAGIGSCKAVAKVACRLAKPRGVLMVPGGTEREFLGPLPVGILPGIGPVAERKLSTLGINTLGQLAEADPSLLRRQFGKWATVLVESARGIGPAGLGSDRPAFREHDPEGYAAGSLSNECTLSKDSTDESELLGVLSGLCERVCYRARKRRVRACTVTLKLRFSDFTTITRSRSIAPTNSELELLPVLKRLFFENARGRAVRLLGVALHRLRPEKEQLGLFECHERLHLAVDELRKRFGYGSVRLAESRSRWNRR